MAPQRPDLSAPKQLSIDDLITDVSKFATSPDSTISKQGQEALQNLKDIQKEIDPRNPNPNTDKIRELTKNFGKTMTQIGETVDYDLTQTSDPAAIKTLQALKGTLQEMGTDKVITDLDKDDKVFAAAQQAGKMTPQSKADLGAAQDAVGGDFAAVVSQTVKNQRPDIAPAAGSGLDAVVDQVTKVGGAEAGKGMGDIRDIVGAEGSLNTPAGRAKMEKLLETAKADMDHASVPNDKVWLDGKALTEQRLQKAIDDIKGGKSADIVDADVQLAVRGHLADNKPGMGMEDIVRREIQTNIGDGKNTNKEDVRSLGGDKAASEVGNAGAMRDLGDHVHQAIDNAVKAAEGQVTGGHAQLTNPTSQPGYTGVQPGQGGGRAAG